MILISNLVAAKLEIPENVGNLAVGSDPDKTFAELFARQNGAGMLESGKTLPEGGENLPPVLPDGAEELVLPGKSPVKPESKEAISDRSLPEQATDEAGRDGEAAKAAGKLPGPADTVNLVPKAVFKPMAGVKSTEDDRLVAASQTTDPQDAGTKIRTAVDTDEAESPVVDSGAAGDIESATSKEALDQAVKTGIELSDANVVVFPAFVNRPVLSSERSAEGAIAASESEQPLPGETKPFATKPVTSEREQPASASTEGQLLRRATVLQVRDKIELKPENAGQTAIARESNSPRAHTAQEFRFELASDNKQVPQERLFNARTGPLASSQPALQPLPAVQPIVHGIAPDATASSSGTSPLADASGLQQGMRPHEFTALVDRLVEARESARGGAVDVAVMHADFGKVSLRFSQDGGNLSVAMANNDPDFTRAVSAAVATDSAQAGDTSSQSGRRDEAGQNTTTASRSNGEGQSSGRGSDMNGSARQQTFRTNQQGQAMPQQPRMPSGESGSSRHGIYA